MSAEQNPKSNPARIPTRWPSPNESSAPDAQPQFRWNPYGDDPYHPDPYAPR